MTLVVRDEQDIIESNLEYHLGIGVDQVIVTDHLSVDATPRILDGYRRRGRVHVVREATAAYDQRTWVTRMARMAYELGARWVINADADEFWWPRSGDLGSALGTVPPEFDVVVARRHNFPPVEDESGHFFERMVHRDVISTNLLGEPLPIKVCHRARPDIVVAQGNHAVVAPGLGGALDDGRIEILHFPLRSYSQFEAKIVSGGTAYSVPGAPQGHGQTWLHAYEQWRAGRLREVYSPRVLTPESISERIARGDLVEDRRLSRRLSADR